MSFFPPMPPSILTFSSLSSGGRTRKGTVSLHHSAVVTDKVRLQPFRALGLGLA